MVRLAKLDTSDLMVRSQVLRFVPRDESQDQEIVLMEAPDYVADELEQGGDMVMRGTQEDSAVLCSHNRTLDMKDAETSNSLVLVTQLWASSKCSEPADLAHPVSIVAVKHTYLEAKETLPRTYQLFNLLNSSRMKDGEEDILGGYTKEQMLDAVQCSEQELLEALKSMSGVCRVDDDDKWVLLDPDYHMRILALICGIVNENSWSWDQVDMKATLEQVEGIERTDVAKEVFQQYFPEGKCDRDKVCRFYGHYLLHTGATFSTTEFTSAWQQALPVVDNGVPFEPDISTHLRGLAHVNEKDATVCLLDENHLPPDIQSRLEKLFATRPKWTLQQIEPYVERLATKKLKVSALLTKYARASTVDGVKFYSCKHAK